MEWQAAQPAPTHVTNTAPSATEDKSTARKIAINVIADTLRDDAVEVLDCDTIDKYREIYRRKVCSKRGPSPDIEPTAEQLSVLKHYRDTRVVPFCCFSLFGPHNHRSQRKLHHTGLMLGSDGCLQRAEYRGPPSFDHWLACWEVYQCALVMLEMVEPAALTAYANHIRDQHRQFGPACWSIIYQAECRFRREHIEILRREESELLNQALAAGGQYPYDPLKPWYRCFDVAPLQHGYWQKYVTIPCLIVVSSAKSAESFLDGDAQVTVSS